MKYHKSMKQTMMRNPTFLILPYSGTKGEKSIRSMKKTLKSKLPANVTEPAYQAMRLKGKFNIKTKTVKEQQHDIMYYIECPEENCNENYVGETGCRLFERVIGHNGWDKNSSIFKHFVEREHRPPNIKSLASWEVIIITNFAEKQLSHYL